MKLFIRVTGSIHPKTHRIIIPTEIRSGRPPLGELFYYQSILSIIHKKDEHHRPYKSLNVLYQY